MKYINQIKHRFLLLALLIPSLSNAQEISLSLKEAVALAAANNPEIRSSQRDIEKSQQQKIIARSLFLPTVNANASVNHFFQLTPFFGFGETQVTNKIPYGRFGGPDQTAAGVSLIQPLFNPLASPTLQRSRLQEQESQIMLTAQEVAILSQVKQTYLQLLVLNQRIALQQESIQRNQHALRDAGALFTQGKGLRVDTLRAYTSVKNLEPQLLKLTYASQTARLRLKALMGIDSAKDFVLTDSLTFPDPATLPTESEVYTTALQSNPDLQRFELQQKIGDQQVRISKAGRMPVVSLAGLYQVQSQTRHLDYASGNFPSSSYAGIQVAVPLFAGFSNQAKVRQAEISEEQSVLHLKNAHAQLFAMVHQVIADSHESLVRLKTTASVQETTKLSYGIVRYRYAKGVSSRLELTDAELALSTSQSNYLEAVYDYLAARISVNQLMGKVE